MGSPVSRRLRLKARKLPDRNFYPVTEPFDPGALSVAISSHGTKPTTSALQNHTDEITRATLPSLGPSLRPAASNVVKLAKR